MDHINTHARYNAQQWIWKILQNRLSLSQLSTWRVHRWRRVFAFEHMVVVQCSAVCWVLWWFGLTQAGTIELAEHVGKLLALHWAWPVSSRFAKYNTQWNQSCALYYDVTYVHWLVYRACVLHWCCTSTCTKVLSPVHYEYGAVNFALTLACRYLLNYCQCLQTTSTDLFTIWRVQSVLGPHGLLWCS